MKEQILHTLQELRTYALSRGVEAGLFYHEEESALMRFANSAVSLNTSEHLVRLEITAYNGRKRASAGLITSLGRLDEMKAGIDAAAEMATHAQPLSYTPTVPSFQAPFTQEEAFDAALAGIANDEKLEYFSRLAEGFVSEQVRLSGIFSSGTNVIAQVSTRSPHAQFFKTSDAQVTAVISHARQKWEVTAGQSAFRRQDLDPTVPHRELSFLLRHYQGDTPLQLPLGRYDIVFGPAAIAELLSFLRVIGYSGGEMKRGSSFLAEEEVGQKVFSERFTLVDDPSRPETFPFGRDFYGRQRRAFPIFERGIFRGFTWAQDDADEFGALPTGHTVSHLSLCLRGGEAEVSTLEELVKMPRRRDAIYIPCLHYMNIVSPSAALVTASSRFGALLLRKDGSVAVPYNVRLTQSLRDIFGDRIAWCSRAVVAQNRSETYGSRNPTAFLVPRFMQVDDMEISHSNSSY